MDLTTEASVAMVILATGSHHPITQKTYEAFLEAADNDYFKLPGGGVFKKASVMDILPMEEYNKQFPDKFQKAFDYHQPYTALPPVSFKEIITRENRSKSIELMAKGLKKAKAKFGDKPTPEIDSLLKLARERYAFLKQNREPINKYNK